MTVQNDVLKFICTSQLRINATQELLATLLLKDKAISVETYSTIEPLLRVNEEQIKKIMEILNKI
jgi:hypothetical protein